MLKVLKTVNLGEINKYESTLLLFSIYSFDKLQIFQFKRNIHLNLSFSHFCTSVRDKYHENERIQGLGGKLKTSSSVNNPATSSTAHYPDNVDMTKQFIVDYDR